MRVTHPLSLGGAQAYQDRMMTTMSETLPATLVLLLDAAKENPQTVIVCLWITVVTLLDFVQHRISNLSTVGGLAIALSMRFAGQGWDGLLDGLAGFAAAFCIYLPLYAAGWMGGGDVKLMAAVGGFLGWPTTLLAVIFSTFVGVAVALLIIAAGGGMGEYLSRYGQMFKLLFFTGQFKYVGPPPGSVATTRFPYAFTIALGTLATLWWAGRLAPFLRALDG